MKYSLIIALFIGTFTSVEAIRVDQVLKEEPAPVKAEAEPPKAAEKPAGDAEAKQAEKPAAEGTLNKGAE